MYVLSSMYTVESHVMRIGLFPFFISKNLAPKQTNQRASLVFKANQRTVISRFHGTVRISIDTRDPQ